MFRTVLVAFLALILGSCSGEGGHEDPLMMRGVIGLSEAFVFDFELEDFNGQPVRDETYRGKLVFAYFGYGSCPDVCPAALSVMSASLNKLGRESDQVTALFISVDPVRDRPAVLKAHLAFDPRIVGLTGSEAAAKAARKGMKVYAEKAEIAGSAMGYLVDHQSLFYVIDGEGTPLYALEDQMRPEDIAAVLRHVLKG